jgi:hypothetical protein
MGANSRWAIPILIVAMLLSSTESRAHGHRTEAAATYSALAGAGSTADGFGTSIGFPLCWITPERDCNENQLSFVAAYSGRLTAEHENAGDVKVQYLLVGVRRSHATRWSRLSTFEHLLVGGVRRRETGSTENFGNWLSGGAASATWGAELVLYRQAREAAQGGLQDPHFDIRLRGQVAGAVYGIGDDVRAGVGYAFALSFGWEID